MAEAHTFVELWRGPRTDFAVMTTAFGLTVVFDLTVGVGAGMIMPRQSALLLRDS